MRPRFYLPSKLTNGHDMGGAVAKRAGLAPLADIAQNTQARSMYWICQPMICVALLAQESTVEW